MLKYGADLQPAEGKRPDDYAGFAEALAAKVNVSDRDRHMLIVDNERELEALATLLNEFRFDYEPFELLLLPEGAETTPLFPDYGFVSARGRAYAYGYLCAVFAFTGGGDGAEPAQAEEQMREHLVAVCEEGGRTRYMADRALNGLMRGIAKAYNCKLEFLYGDD